MLIVPVAAEEIEDVEECVGEEDNMEVDVYEEEEEVEDEDKEGTNLNLCNGRKYLLSLIVCRAPLLSLTPKVIISIFLLTLKLWTSLSSFWMMIFLA